MRTKTLILTLALGAAMAVTTQAQVYSQNAVGYVNITLPAGFCIIANPLNGTNNDLNTILPLDAAADGTLVFRFDPAAQNYLDAISFIGGFGWFDPDPANLVIDPGEGFFISVPAAAAPLNITFVGEVPQATGGNPLQNPIPGNNNFSIKSSQVPQALPLGDTVAIDDGDLDFPAGDGDNVFIFDCAAQTYKEAYGYIDGFGWFSTNPDDPGPVGPTIPVATGFFVLKAGADASWDRDFTVN